MFEDRHPSTHPPHPPTTEDDRVSWLRLLRSRRVGPTTFHKLLAEHGSAAAALDALPAIASAAGVTGYAPCPIGVAEAELNTAHRLGAHMLCFGAPDYPRFLDDVPDAPPVLWAMGTVDVLTKPPLAMVGARNASSLGTRMARALARDLAAEGFAIVSGLARGIDTAAHLASLETGTIAVMAGGVDILYPAENAKLGRDIEAHGLRLSEQPFGMEPMARHFPARNRIISGMARALIVVEAAVKSGSLITARAALDQGREVLAVPGHPFEPRASGCNQLLRDGAVLVRSAQDVLDALAPGQISAAQPTLPLDAPAKAPDRRSLRDTAKLHSDILGRLSPVPLAEDQLLRDLDAPPARVTPVLTDLEMDGKIIRHPGGLLSRATPS